MIKQIVNRLLIMLAVFGLVGFFAFAVPVEGQPPTPKDQLCEGLEIATNQGCEEDPGRPTVTSVIQNVVRILTIAVGIIAIIMIIIAGLKYITSSGDSGNITSAKNTLLYAVIGLIIVALAQIIVRFVLSETATAPPSAPTNVL